jgi:hypothetical protein
MKRPAVLLAMMLAGCASVNASYLDGRRLHALCSENKDKGSSTSSLASGYIAGVSDSQERNVVLGAKRTFCQPDTVPLSVLTEAVCQWVGSHPDVRSLPGESLVRFALVDTWPCAKQ